MLRGILDKPSSVETMTTGRVNNASVREAQNSPPVPKVGAGNASGKKKAIQAPPQGIDKKAQPEYAVNN